MIVVVDKKVTKHLVETGGALLEIPVRVSFQYNLDAGEFVSGSMERSILYNRKAALRRLPRRDGAGLDEEIESAVDRMLIEHLRFSRQAGGHVSLYPEPDPEPPSTENPPPKIILP